MKKFFLIVMAALGVSLVLAGCGDPEAGAAGVAGAAAPVTFNTAPSVEAIQAAIAKGLPIWLDNAEITGSGTLDFGTVDVTVYGTLSSSASTDVLYIIAGPNVKLAEGASIELGETGDYFFGTADHVAAAAGAQAANVVQTAAAIPETGTVTAVKDLELDKDLSIPSGLKVFVYGTLTINGTADEPTAGYGNGGITAIGTVKVTKDNTAALSAATKVDVTGATILYEGTTAVAVTLPAALEVAAFKVTGDGGVLKVTGGATSVTAAVTQNNGFVEFVSAVVKATITGKGRIRFADSANAATAFTGASSVTTNSISGSVIEFANGFSTSQYAAVALSGDVYIAGTKAITFNHAGGTLTLKAGAAVKAGTSKDNAGDPAVLSAPADTLLTPVATAALTATAKAGAGTAPKLSLGTESLELTSGTLVVPAGAVLDLATSGKSLTVKVATGSLVLTGAAGTGGAKITGAGSVAVGNASITGGASGAWQAGGASTTITFAASAAAVVSVTGTGTSPFLAGVTNDSALITLAKGSSNGNGAALTVTNATIDLSANGGVKFPYVDTTPATLVLKGGSGTLGALKLGTGTTANTNLYLTKTNSVTISGTSPVIQGASDAAGAAAGLISGGTAAGTNDATITGQTSSNDVTVTKGATLAAASS